MPFRRAMLRATLLIAVFEIFFLRVSVMAAQDFAPETGSQAAPLEKQTADTPTFRSTTALVFLDVTVVDKKGRPVVTGLTRDDFSITEDKKPQRIFSFEMPEVHTLSDASQSASSPDSDGVSDYNPEGKAPETILVLDLLNSKFEEFSFVRDQARKFLEAQPESMKAPTEMMVLGNNSLDLLQGFTRNKKDLLFALDHLPTIWPYKSEYRINFESDLIRQSYIALQQIAVQSKGVSGRKNVIWIGRGGPNMDGSRLPDPLTDKVRLYVHHTVNMMVEARITLYLIHPGFLVHARSRSKWAGSELEQFGKNDPFGDAKSGFTDFVEKTGGRIFDRNDVSAEMDEATQLGSQYYTLTYQPHEAESDGRFRQVRVTVRNPDLRVVTKTGYFSPEKNESVKSDDRMLDQLSEAAMATMPFKALGVRVSNVVRHPDAHSAEITIELDDKRIAWQTLDNGKSSATVIVTGVSRSAREDVLASRVAKFYLLAASQDPDKLAGAKPTVTLTLPVPRQTKNVRVALEMGDGGRIGSVDLDRKAIDAAPEAPTAKPRLQSSRVPVSEGSTK